MPRASARKPEGAVGHFGLSSGQTKCVTGALVIAVVIGLSAYFSPAEDAAVAATAVGSKPKTAVTTLDDTSFDKFVASHPDGVLVDFYSRSCKFCVKLAPEFEKAAKQLKEGPALVSVDSEAGAAIVERFGINRYPTVLWLWKGQNVLELPRAAEKPAEKIVEWAKWATTPAVQELDTISEFEEALTTLRSTLHAKARLMVAFNRPEGAAGMREAFEAAAQRNRHTTVFLWIKDVSVAGAALKAYAPEDTADEDYAGANTAEEVVAWVKATLEKAKPSKAEEVTPPEDAKPAATKAMEQVQQALKNAENSDANTE